MVAIPGDTVSWIIKVYSKWPHVIYEFNLGGFIYLHVIARRINCKLGRNILAD